MFTDSILETSWDQRSRRSWTTLTSFGLQAAAMGLLLMLPLVKPEGLPFLHHVLTPVTLGQPYREPATVVVHTGGASTRWSAPLKPSLMLPSPIRSTASKTADDFPPQPLGPAGPYLPGGAAMPIGAPFAGPGSRVVMPSPPPTVNTHSPRISHMMEGNLIRRVQPDYPPLARSARIQGQVELSAVISKAGTIENLRVLAGHPMLVGAAIEAVRQWRYRPYILNGEPVEVETRITVKFSLSGS
jgi:protein TonB